MHAALVTQVIGLLATVASVSSVTLKCDQALRRVAAAGQFTWMVHFWLIGSATTATLALLMCVRQLSSGWLAGRMARVQFVASGGFYVAFTLATALTWQGWMSLLPWAVAMLANFAYSSLTGVAMRRVLRVVDCVGLCNGALLGSIGGVVTAGLAIGLNTLTIRELDRGRPPPAAAVTATAA
jgi:hypothetical protein